MAARIRQGFSSTLVNFNGAKSRNEQKTWKINYNLEDKTSSQRKAPVKSSANEKKSRNVPKTLPPLEDPDLPPLPEMVPAKQASTATVVTWDMRTSKTDSLVGTVDAIGAHCPLEKLDNDAMFLSRVAVRGFSTNHSGELVNGKDGYEIWMQDDKQCLDSFVKWLANISNEKSESKENREATSNAGFSTHKIVLLSFGGITARIPKLLLALRRHKLLRQFQDVVIGLCDVNAAALGGDPSAPIGTVSRNVLGLDMPETDDPALQSRYLYRVIAQLFGKKLIAAHLHPLARKTFTTSYVMKLSAWRFKTDHRANDLRAILTTRVGKSVKRKRSLIKNLLAVGYDYTSLRKQYEALGEFVFREVLLNKLRNMKQFRESNLTETREVGCKTVIESVVNHFKEIQRDRLFKRVPPLD